MQIIFTTTNNFIQSFGRRNLSKYSHSSLLQFFEEGNQRESQLFDDKTVSGTALVTPGLFKTVILLIDRVLMKIVIFFKCFLGYISFLTLNLFILPIFRFQKVLQVQQKNLERLYDRVIVSSVGRSVVRNAGQGPFTFFVSHRGGWGRGVS